MRGPGELCPAAIAPEKSIAPIATNFAPAVQFVIISAHLGALRISTEALYTTHETASPRHTVVPRPRKRASNLRLPECTVLVARFHLRRSCCLRTNPRESMKLATKNTYSGRRAGCAQPGMRRPRNMHC